MSRPTADSSPKENPYRHGTDPNKAAEWEGQRLRAVHERTAASIAEAASNERRHQQELGKRSSSTSGCFAAGTKIDIAGGTMPIENIVAGTRVLAKTQESLAALPCEVLRVKRYRSTIWTVWLDGREEPILTTARHPFGTTRGWVPTRNLRPGDRILSATAVPFIVASVWNTKHSAPVYNIIVDRTFTYIADGCLVHSFGVFRRARVSWYRFLATITPNRRVQIVTVTP